jgi:hypothetical protein
MLLTFSCIAVVLGSIVLVGVPITWLLKGRCPLGREDFVSAPFLGMATIVLVLQNLVYLNVPLCYSTPFFWGAIVLCWLWMWHAGGMKGGVKECPWVMAVAVLAVYLVQGLGLLSAGARDYVGRGWTDQWNYTAISQFLMDEPFSTSWNDLGNRPYLACGIHFKSDRIGQSVLQGFLATTALQDAKPLFEPTILLGPALCVLAIYSLGRRLELEFLQALLAGVVAGLLPGMALMHLESFQSQALSVPLLLFLPVVVHEMNESLRPGALLKAALVFAAATTIYTEIWVVLLGLVILNLAILLWGGLRKRRVLAYYLLLILAPFTLNPWFSPLILAITSRVNGAVLTDLYPWAYSVEGIGRLWLGDLTVRHTAMLQSIVRVCSLLITGVAMLGLWLCWRKRVLSQSSLADQPSSHLSFALASSVLALIALPVMIFASDDRHPYQYYKLLLSVSPLLVLGIALFWTTVLPRGEKEDTSPCARLIWLRAAVFPGCLGGLLVLVAVASGKMAADSARNQPMPRSFAALVRTRDLRKLESQLAYLPPGNLILAFRDPIFPPLQNSYLMYYGRRHRIWLADDHYIDADPKFVTFGKAILDMGGIPAEAYLLTRDCGAVRPIDPGQARLLWSGHSYQLWQTQSRHWAAPIAWSQTGKPTLTVRANCPGMVRLRGDFFSRKGLPNADSLRLKVQTSAGYDSLPIIFGGTEELSIPVPTGETTITLELAGGLRQTDVPPRDASPSVPVGVHTCEFHFTPHPSANDSVRQFDQTTEQANP